MTHLKRERGGGDIENSNDFRDLTTKTETEREIKRERERDRERFSTFFSIL